MDKYWLYKIVLKPSHTKEADWTQSVVAETTDLSKAQETLEILLISVFKEDRRLPIGKEPETGAKVLPNSILDQENRPADPQKRLQTPIFRPSDFALTKLGVYPD